MLDGLIDEEVNHLLEDHPMIVLLFDIDIVTTVNPYVSKPAKEEKDIDREPDPKSVEELRYAREVLERELAISQCVKASTLEKINLGTTTNPRTLKIAKEMASDERLALVGLLIEYKDIFAWSYNNMKGLHRTYYQHQIHLKHDARPRQQCRYRMNHNYAAKVKEEINKILHVGFIRPMKHATWLSPIMVIAKKNGKLRVCVDYRKLNSATIIDAFPLPFTDSMLDAITGA